MEGYKPIDSLSSPRFSQVRTFMRLPNIRTLEGVDFAVFGIPFDTGCSFRIGSRFGPEAIRSISVLLKPYNIYHKIDIFEYLSGVDYGDLSVIPGFIEETYDNITKEMLPLLQAGVVPVALGGDHSITLGELRAVSRIHGQVSLIHFDAHLDTAEAYFGKKYNHGTPFSRAAEEGLIDTATSIQVGIRGSSYGPGDIKHSQDLGFQVITAEEVYQIGLSTVAKLIREKVGNRKAFVTFDIDSIDPAYAPGTGTIETGGFTSREALFLVRSLAGLKIVGYDLVEVLPDLDHGQITASLASNLVYEFISLIALEKRNEKV